MIADSNKAVIFLKFFIFNTFRWSIVFILQNAYAAGLFPRIPNVIEL